MRARAGAAAAAIAVAVATGAGVPALTLGAVAAGPDGDGAAVAPVVLTRSGPPSTATVTLITGDRVTLTRHADGRSSAAVTPGAGREGIAFQRITEGDRLHVIPADVAGLVPDRMDSALFDVSGLVAAGYDDANRGTVPVIVQDAAVAHEAAAGSDMSARGDRTASGAGKPQDRRQPDWAALGLEPERTLESAGAISADLDREAAADLLAGLRRDTSRSAARSTTPEVKVWLDAPVQALDEDSMPQIGAPAAWEAGYTGEGVTVAVLDSGVDRTHPDLDDVVVGAKDFTGSGNTKDHYGHGTHVASIALGSGDASGGENRGVAPGADLLVGKVLDEFGGGEMSSVVDGMEWAAGEGADVVNLSLGESENYTDGTDPTSVALDTLSARHGTLFVVAAGNDGEYGTVATPGAASSALTVGAVDDADDVATFSSRGPRALDQAIKPDVTAPGVEIVAARAAGTKPGSGTGKYVAWSGTSMAAPHVAGAAAVLKQARPDLSAQQLKAVLMGSAQHTSGGVFDEGAGRIYLPAALELPVMASPDSLSFGALEFPQQGRVKRTLTYENDTDTAVTLDLAVTATRQDGKPLPARAVTLGSSTLTVPAQGTATVDVRVNTTVGAVERRYSGAVTATGPDGQEVRTPLGYYKEPDLADLKIDAVGRDGKPHAGSSTVRVVNVDDPALFSEHLEIGAEGADLRVPPGSYSVTGFLWTADEEFVVSEATAVLHPEVKVADDTALVLDARTARELTVTTQRPAGLASLALDDTRTAADGEPYGFGLVVTGEATAYATPTKAAVTTGTHDLQTHFVLTGPSGASRAPSYTYDLLYAQEVVDTFKFRATERNTAPLTTGYAALGTDHRNASARVGFAADHLWGSAVSSPVATPGRRTEYVSANGVAWGHEVYVGSAESDQGYFQGEPRTYAPREKARTTVGGAVLGTRLDEGAITAEGRTLALGLVPWSDADRHPFDSFGGDTTRLRVWQDGAAVADNTYPSAQVRIPAGGADHRVVLGAAWEAPWWDRSTRVRTEWTFHAEPGGSKAGSVDLPVLDVAYAVKGMSLANKAPRQTTATVTVGHQAGSSGGKVTGARLWWSPDDGVTWHKAALRRTGAGVYTSGLKVPTGTEHVSVRVEARDAAGGTIEQTVIRAYGVR
ncbi:Subtilase family protein [Promicromonospora umidemergens]|uniref:S8 family serine peptidase n=1 Tax=Promicromonospora umidemergens TaxID=629679 RepID=A0ABP8Y4J1_9MICO|nr:S8 family serine peptidase [Promicromonospora umidemergens]MCP2284616.1 Subtilase family protein [Promicromonospora umidemergens]